VSGGGVGDLVHRLDDGVHGGVDADRQAGEADVVVDRGRDSGHPDRVAPLLRVGDGHGPGERAVTADDQELVDAALGQVGAGPVASRPLQELEAPGRAQQGAALAQDPGDVAGPERDQLALDQAAVAALHAEDLVALGQRDQRGGAHRCVHAGGVAAAGEDGQSLAHGAR
jgi:hypothetical protein